MSEMLPDPEDATKWMIADASGAVLGEALGPTVLGNVHSPNRCAGYHCVVHNPSDHHMRKWRLNWRDDRGIMERICPHGIGHPDPDEMAYQFRANSGDTGVHGCDGCCG